MELFIFLTTVFVQDMNIIIFITIMSRSAEGQFSSLAVLV